MVRTGFVRAGLVIAAASLLTNVAGAQKLTVTPGGALTAGAKAVIEYEDPDRAGLTVVVQVSGGFPVATTIEVEVPLDGKGKGKGEWTVVKGWRNAHFDAPGTSGLMLPIM